MGVPPKIIKKLEHDHELVLKPMVTTGDKPASETPISIPWP